MYVMCDKAPVQDGGSTMMRTAAVTDQMDPKAVVDKLVELVEAESTLQNNIVPEDGIEELNEATGLGE